MTRPRRSPRPDRQQTTQNGFLAAAWSGGWITPIPSYGFQIRMFVLLCVIVAGLYGALTVSRRIPYVQAMPAAVAADAALAGVSLFIVPAGMILHRGFRSPVSWKKIIHMRTQRH